MPGELLLKEAVAGSWQPGGGSILVKSAEGFVLTVIAFVVVSLQLPFVFISLTVKVPAFV